MNCILCSAAGPHTVINGKEVVNFTSANYLGLIGHEKLLVRQTHSYYLPIFIMIILYLNIATNAIFHLRNHALLHWRNMVLVLVVLVVSMEQLVRLNI